MSPNEPALVAVDDLWNFVALFARKAPRKLFSKQCLHCLADYLRLANCLQIDKEFRITLLGEFSGTFWHRNFYRDLNKILISESLSSHNNSCLLIRVQSQTNEQCSSEHFPEMDAVGRCSFVNQRAKRFKRNTVQ